MLRKIEQHVLGQIGSLLGKEPELRLLVCVSGGADSMALLHMLRQLRDHAPTRKKLRLNLAAVHFNHEKRGADSEADSRLVRSTLAEWGVPLVVERWSETGARSLPSCSRAGNFQDSARVWRYSRAAALLKHFFCEHAATAWVVTAHHARDNVESILLNMTRGTGVEGLQGIARVDSERRLARPLLERSYHEICAYVREHGVPFRLDSSNTKTDYSRNALRLKVLPVLAEINPKFEDAFTRLAQNAQSVLAEIHVPEGPLPLGEGMSTTQILKLAKRTSASLAQNMTTEVLGNILHHVRLVSRRRSPVPTKEIPLANGWVAQISDAGLRFVKALPEQGIAKWPRHGHNDVVLKSDSGKTQFPKERS
jgi:tRNA(Ile)-lysidine synthetase-like protein